MEDLSGYRGEALRLLKRGGASVGDVLEIKTAWGAIRGTLVPRYAYADDGHIVVKLKSGYNVGLVLSGLEGVKVVSRGEKPSFTASPPPKRAGRLPRVLLLGTGGTIASRIDYRTGAVRAAVSAAELHSLVPELSEVADVKPEIMFDIFSENIAPEHWTKLALRVARGVKQGYDGVVIAHGTDTMGYTSAALSFALSGIPIPVVLVGSQRSSDRPSSDGPMNLVAAVSAAGTAPFSGVYVAMHMGESDDRVVFHQGTRVRKNHTSRRDAFVSVGVPPAAVWGRSGIEDVSPGIPSRGAKGFRPRPKFSSRASLIKFYPSMPPGMIASAKRLGAKVIVLEGTGMGHVSKGAAKEVERCIAKGGIVCMTSQCIGGRVDLNVYDSGRDLLRIGVLPLEDMLAETALVKAMWALANTTTVQKAKTLMQTVVAGETTTRTFPTPAP